MKFKASKILTSFTSVVCFLLCINFALASTEELFSQPYLNQIQTVKLQSSGNKIIVAVIDEGIDFNTDDLKSKEYQRKNFVGGNNKQIFGSHGTQVASILNTVSNNNQDLKFLDLVACKQDTGCNLDAIISAIYFAADNKASIINLSLQVDQEQSYLDNFNKAIEYAFNKGAVIVVAAGNGDRNLNAVNLTNTPISPVCNDNGQNMVLGVSSKNFNGQLFSWANFGNCVDIFAPGENIYVSQPAIFNNGQNYSYENGTSFSAAMVSGAAALIKIKNPMLPGKDVQKILMESSNENSFLNISNALKNTPVSKKIARKNYSTTPRSSAQKPAAVLGASIKANKTVQIQETKISKNIHLRGQKN